ncbi:hypothetical protein MTBBW1_1790025 [Desulfamplus magnetovallimortis]|uniref:Uncharacterized protein n=1 Tax=Desulfamplus magnetovallimortis TaxID=1246637 RepID=A0A1W1HA85_9BACT|nr:HAD hydrolase family protein [Desulfamplus magnetovallimortis]SLM29400.1 hypothetical protein MTBBW1_1790025 [Desulfamplus magnetovallimortis]
MPNYLINAVVCDLDGTLLYPQKEAIPVAGRSGVSYLGKEAAKLLVKISQICPVVIATGRNAVGTRRLVRQLPDVLFKGFVFENGFVVKRNINESTHYNRKWERIAALFPEWERLAFYENCAGFIPPLPERESAEKMAKTLLKKRVTMIL